MRIALLVALAAMGCGTKSKAPVKPDVTEPKRETDQKLSTTTSTEPDDAPDPDHDPDGSTKTSPTNVGAGSGSAGGFGSGGTMKGDGLRRRSPTTVAAPTSQGNLDKAIIRRYVKRSISKISECYEKELTTQPTLEGKVTIQFTIMPDGKVQKATGSGLPKVDACVAAVIQTIEFPKPTDGGSVHVNYPFTFRPGSDG
jgi:TonB family protein